MQNIPKICCFKKKKVSDFSRYLKEHKYWCLFSLLPLGATPDSVVDPDPAFKVVKVLMIKYWKNTAEIFFLLFLSNNCNLLIRRCAADFSLLNLPKGKSLGCSKPATNS
jgi:hypothetical protein